MRILVVNVHSARNAGDAVLNDVTLQQLQTAFPRASITFLVNDPESYAGREDVIIVGSFTCWMKRHGRWQWPTFLSLSVSSLLVALRYRLFHRFLSEHSHLPWASLLRAYQQTDLIVSCPGNFLYSSGKLGLPLLINLYTMAYGWLLGKPLYMMPQSIGPLSRRREQYLVKWVLSRMRMVLVREDISLAMVRRLGLRHRRCYLVPDVAFAFPAASRARGAAMLQEYGVRNVEEKRPLLGITLINWAAQNRWFHCQHAYEQAVCQAARAFITRWHGSVILFSQVQGPAPADDDRIPAARVYASLVDWHDHVVFIERVVTPAELKAAYSLMDLFIGTRLHSNIFALSEGVPVIAIQYQYKTQGVMRMLGLEQWVIDIEEVDGERLTALLEQAWSEQLNVRRQLQETMPAIVEQAATVGQRIGQDFNR